LPRGRLSPLSDPALKCAELTIWEDAGQFTLKAREEFFTDTVGLGLEPCAHAWPCALERILSGTPITRWPRREAMGGADLSLLPRRGQTSEKPIEASLAARS
jgi:hypothetical protein